MRGKIAEALEYLKLRGRSAENLEYLRPGGDPLQLDGVPGVRVYILGPPEDPGLLKTSSVTEEMKGQDLIYHLATMVTWAWMHWELPWLPSRARLRQMGSGISHFLTSTASLARFRCSREPLFRPHQGFRI